MKETLLRKYTQYMKDCGCDESQTAEYLALAERGDRLEQLWFLKRLRCQVMDALHDANRRVDRIDFIIHELEQEE